MLKTFLNLEFKLGMRLYKTEGIVLKRKNFREADRILTVFTKSHGKIMVNAPGVRRITSRRSSHIELLNLSIFTLYQSAKSFYPIVTEAQVLEDFSSIKNSLGKIGFAYYICELIDSLCAQNQENRGIFFLAKDILFKLNNYSLNNEIIDNFENELLVALGFLPKLNYLNNKYLFIEQILERRLSTRRLLPVFLTPDK